MQRVYCVVCYLANVSQPLLHMQSAETTLSDVSLIEEDPSCDTTHGVKRQRCRPLMSPAARTVGGHALFCILYCLLFGQCEPAPFVRAQ